MRAKQAEDVRLVLAQWLNRCVFGPATYPLVLVGENAREVALGVALQMIADNVDAIVAPLSWLDAEELPEPKPELLVVLVDLDTPDDIDETLEAWSNQAPLLIGSESLTPILPRSRVVLV